MVAFIVVLFVKSALAQTLPYDPYRKVGSKYYSIQPVYNWINACNAARMQHYPVDQWPRNPMPAWFGFTIAVGGISTHYRVFEVIPDGILVNEERVDISGNAVDDPPFLLKDYPYSVADNQEIHFLALRTGTYQYTDVRGATRTAIMYDYGVPYDPWKLQAEKNIGSQTPPTNSIKPGLQIRAAPR